jgi:fibronectin type 3 domain-containing protein
MRLYCSIILLLATIAPLSAGSMADPAVDDYNLRFGSQVFNADYQFTTNLLLVEGAQGLTNMGSANIKLYLGFGYLTAYNGPTNAPSPAPGITNLTQLARDEPSWRKVYDMPFKNYFQWCYTFANPAWADGMSTAEKQAEYNEIYNLTAYFLTNYNNSGKTFYLGNWEADGMLGYYSGQGGPQFTNNPNPVIIRGMIDYFNTRQQAIDDAKRATPHTNVNVYYYVEVNNVTDAMYAPADRNQYVINAVVPYLTNLDYVAWSNYSGSDQGGQAQSNMLNYVQAHLPTNKAAVIPGKRVFVTEFSFGAQNFIAATNQEPYVRKAVQRFLNWGCPFTYQWEFYGNLDGTNTNDQYWLIAPDGSKTPCFYFYHNYYNKAKLLLGLFKQVNGRLPTDTEYQNLLSPYFNQPCLTPVSLTLANGAWNSTSSNSATISGTLTQGVYGQDWARVSLCWGTADGSTNNAVWQNVTVLGTNSTFGAAMFTATLSNLTPAMVYYYSFYATNQSGSAWSPASTKSIAPVPPTGIITIPGNGLMTLSWPAVGGATGYRVKQSAGYAGGPYTLIGSPTSNAFTNTGLTNGVTYYYVVSSTNANGEGVNSLEVSATAISLTNVVDNFDDNVQATGRNSWQTYGTGQIVNGFWLTLNTTTSAVPKSITFTPNLAVGGSYDVYLSWPGSTYVGTVAPVDVNYLGGTATLSVNQSVNGGGWNYLGRYNFSYGMAGSVRLHNDGANGNMDADAVEFVPVNVSPLAPVLSATAGNLGQVALTWNVPASATGYNVKRGLVAGGPYAIIASIATNNFADTNVVAGTGYYYVVTATNANGESPLSNEAATTPSLIVDNADLTGVTIVGAWSASSSTPGYYGTNYLLDGNTGATGGKSVRFTPNLSATGTYAVYLRWTANANRASNTPVDLIFNGGTNTFSVNQQTNGGLWVWLGNFNFAAGSSGSVLVRNDGANGYVVADAMQFVLATPLPSTPVQLAATTGNGWVNLSWKANSGATSYNVKRSTDAGPFITIANTSGNSFADSTVANGMTYNYVVSALNNAGESSNSLSVVATPNCLMLAPTWLNALANATNTQVSLAWNSPVGALSFNVKRSTTSGGPYITLSNLFLTSFVDTNVVKGTVYFYVVSAITPCGEGSNSTEIATTPGIVVDNADSTGVTITGSWFVGASAGYYGINYLQDANAGGGKSVRFTPTLPVAGNYDVYLWWVASGNRATNEPVDVVFSNGTNTFSVDQTSNGSSWNYLGTFAFNAGTGGHVLVRDDGASGYVIADAVQFVLDTPAPSVPSNLTATGGINSVALVWQSAASASLYNVKRAPASAGTYVTIGSTTGTNYVDGNVTNGVTYYYKTSSVNGWGESSNSAFASATPVALVLDLSLTNNGLVVTWPASAAGYTLQAATSLTAPVNWMPQFTVSNGQTTAVLATTNAMMFYQMRSP